MDQNFKRATDPALSPSQPDARGYTSATRNESPCKEPRVPEPRPKSGCIETDFGRSLLLLCSPWSSLGKGCKPRAQAPDYLLSFFVAFLEVRRE